MCYQIAFCVLMLSLGEHGFNSHVQETIRYPDCMVSFDTVVHFTGMVADISWMTIDLHVIAMYLLIRNRFLLSLILCIYFAYAFKWKTDSAAGKYR